jgi:large subunit ribosomal protein L6
MIRQGIIIPKGITVSLDKHTLTVNGPKGKISRTFVGHGHKILIESESIVLECPTTRKKDRAVLGTWNGHIINMMTGVMHEFEYRMKIIYSHFPIKVSIKEDKVVIENFLGEREPRFADIAPGVKVEAKGDTVTLRGIDIEALGMTAARIEYATKIKAKDPRVFQDGIYIIAKGEIPQAAR